jgi:membrane protein implicated in regulation of membrane protease activity
MYELKQGRASMFMGGVGGLLMVGFAALWTGLCVSLGAPIWFSLFGVLFGVFGLVVAIFSFWAATTKDRPDLFDVTTDREEPDPLNRRFGRKQS